MRNVYLITVFVGVALVSILGFRGTKFTSPPLDVFPEWAFPGMKYQPRPRPQDASAFFADGRSDRMPVPHTVARGMLRDDDALHFGKDASGAFLKGFPQKVTVDEALIRKGAERYQIYCAVCHGATGAGDGMTARYGMGTLASNGNFSSDRIRGMADGELYNTITNGSASKVMFPYADKLAPEERWAVVAYVRALQRAQRGSLNEVDPNNAQAKKDLGL